jgi:hypothetical protein
MHLCARLPILCVFLLVSCAFYHFTALSTPWKPLSVKNLGDLPYHEPWSLGKVVGQIQVKIIKYAGGQ